MTDETFDNKSIESDTGEAAGPPTSEPAASRPRRRRAASRPVGAPPAAVPQAESAAPAVTDEAAGETDRPGVEPALTDEAAGVREAPSPEDAVAAAEVLVGEQPAEEPVADANDAATDDAIEAAAIALAQGEQGGEDAPAPPAVEPPAPVTPPAPEGRVRRSARRPAAPAVMFQAPEPTFVAPPPPEAAPAAPAPEPPAAVAESEQAGQADQVDEAEELGEESGEERAESEEGGAPRRRRRRGRRGRGRTRDEDGEAESAEGEDAEAGEAAASEASSGETPAAEETADEGAGEAEGGESGSARRRRTRQRRKKSGSDEGESPRSAEDEIRGVNGSTRLEAKRQRRRESRDTSRRRPPVVTEAEFLARRESVKRVMVVRNAGDRTQVAVLEDDVLVEHYVTRASSTSYAGNVYLGRVQNVLPSMEAAFVDIGKGRNGVLYAGEVNYDASGLEGKPRKIEQALKPGQGVVVQVTKDPIGHKGARLTSQVSLPGRYMVYVPDGGSAGISRKLPDSERSRLRSILKKITPEDAGVIVRTAAEGASEEELSKDISRLAAQWADIQKKSTKASPPSLLYAEPDLVIRVIRDIFNEDFTELVVQGEAEWQQISAYVEGVAPDLLPRLRKESSGDVFAEARIDEQLLKALDRKVYLPSGGSLVFDRTEAMTVVDVNTGRFTGKGGNLEETVTKNNLEAAEELVRQLRLRDIGGIIVVDFIDMVLESNRELVLRRLTECLGRDRTKHQVAEVTSLGLVQMTRKRVGQGLLEAYSEPCPTCGGRGHTIDLPGPGGARPKPKPIPRRPAAPPAAEGNGEGAGEIGEDGPADEAGPVDVEAGAAVSADSSDDAAGAAVAAEDSASEEDDDSAEALAEAIAEERRELIAEGGDESESADDADAADGADEDAGEADDDDSDDDEDGDDEAEDEADDESDEPEAAPALAD